MKQIVILAGPCAKREVVPEINRQIKMHNAAGADRIGEIGLKDWVRTDVIAERLRSASEGTRRLVLHAIDNADVRISDDRTFFDRPSISGAKLLKISGA